MRFYEGGCHKRQDDAFNVSTLLEILQEEYHELHSNCTPLRFQPFSRFWLATEAITPHGILRFSVSTLLEILAGTTAAPARRSASSSVSTLLEILEVNNCYKRRWQAEAEVSTLLEILGRIKSRGGAPSATLGFNPS